MFYTYVYEDPKTFEPRYVGKGHGDRALAHYKRELNTRLHRMLKKREREGFQMVPTIIQCPSELSALAVERFWIAVFGRENVGTGTLFNLTDGGEGVIGLRWTNEQRAKQSIRLRGRKWSSRTYKPSLHRDSKTAASKPCTIDGGTTIYPNVGALIKAHGKGKKTGYYSSTFRWVVDGKLVERK